MVDSLWDNSKVTKFIILMDCCVSGFIIKKLGQEGTMLTKILIVATLAVAPMLVAYIRYQLHRLTAIVSMLSGCPCTLLHTFLME